MTHNSLPTIYEACTPRQDILDGNFESGLAADLSQVVNGKAGSEYTNSAKFFAGTYPTKGIRILLSQVLQRLRGTSSSAVFWLDTSFGGGKTHALIALFHATQSPDPDTISEFVDTSLISNERVKLAVFDGNTADISSGHDMGDGVLAHTPWGEIAYQLGGEDGYRRVDDSKSASAPGADTIRELLGNEPSLILLDELAVYLRRAMQHPGAEAQFTAFLTSLIKAVEETSNAALIFTLALGEDKRRHISDAYANENLRLAELKSVASRKATILNPTEEGETIQVLKRRLFIQCDEDSAKRVAEVYKKIWDMNRDKLPSEMSHVLADEFITNYPLHPEILKTLVSKTATLENFQRIRGMLRLLGHVVRGLWRHRQDIPKPLAIHLHHLDMGREDVRLEIITRAGQGTLVSAIDTDVACDTRNKTSMAQKLDKDHYPDMPPFTTYVARTILMHSLASLKQLKGIDDKCLRYSILSPGMEIGFIDEALDRFKAKSLYLDDDPQKLTQFQAEPNLNRKITQAEQSLVDGDLEGEIDRRMKKVFQGDMFDVQWYPQGHADVDENIEKPKLVIPRYTDVMVTNPESPPDLVLDIFRHKGVGGPRLHPNNLVFLVAHRAGLEPMYRSARAYLARAILSDANHASDLAEYQRAEIKKQKKHLDKKLNDMILQCYKYLHYPQKGNILNHIVMIWKGKVGQSQIVEELRDANKMRMRGDDPDSSDSLVNRINKLNTEGYMSTQKFRQEFYENTGLPLLVGNDVFIKGIVQGIDDGVFVYERGDIIRGKGDASCAISISDDATVYTTECAKQLGKWPHRAPSPEPLKPIGPKPPVIPGPEPLKPPIGPDLKISGIPKEVLEKISSLLPEPDIHKITNLRISTKDNVFPLLIAVNQIKRLKVKAKIRGDYKTAGGVFRFEYDGTLDGTVNEIAFLREQLRNTDIPNITVELDISLADVNINWLEELAEHLKGIRNPIKILDIAGHK